MYQKATYVDWDFTDIWEIDESNDYPTHQWIRKESDIKAVCYPL